MTELCEPRSDEGSVHRDDWVAQFEPIFYGFGAVIGVAGVLTSAAHGDWRWVALMLLVPAAMIVLTRRLYFRPHLVIARDSFLLVGMFSTRRIPMVMVKRAVAERGSLRLVLVDGDEVYVPGHYLWRHAHGDAYSGLASTINNVLSARVTSGA